MLLFLKREIGIRYITGIIQIHYQVMQQQHHYLLIIGTLHMDGEVIEMNDILHHLL